MTTSADAARESLAARQEALVAALVGGAEVPPRFDAAAVEATRRALWCKRTGEAAKAWPAMRSELGDGFLRRFAAYAATTPPPPGGPSADGFGFARALGYPQLRSDEARVELAAGRATWSRRRGQVRRRRASIAVTRVGEGRSVVVFARLPGLGLRRIGVRVEL